MAEHQNSTTVRCYYEFKKRDDTRPDQDCTMDVFYNCDTTMRLPNFIQLVESDVPLCEAKDKFSGVFLFRQILSPSYNTMQCLFCSIPEYFQTIALLETHYHSIHDLAVDRRTAAFNEDIVFVIVPSDDVTEEDAFESSCHFCNTTLKTLPELHDHYPNAHNKIVRLLSKSDVFEIGNFFYCGLCDHPSIDFNSHLQHMKVMHKRRTYVCSYCTHCTSSHSLLRTHVKQRHLKNKFGLPLQCSVCSVYVHGKDRLTEHIMSFHAVQTGIKTWSCARCFYPYGDQVEFMTHIPTCSKLQSSQKKLKKTDGSAENKQNNIFCNCKKCTSIPRQEIASYICANSHGSKTVTIKLENKVYQEYSTNFDRNTCFLCCQKFPTVEMCRKHLHHVHMQWLKIIATDDSKDGLTEKNEGEIGQPIPEIQSKSVLEFSLNQINQSSVMSNIAPFEKNVKSQMNGQQIFSHSTTETAEDEQAATVSLKETLLDQQSSPEFMTSDLDSGAERVFEAMAVLTTTTDESECSDEMSIDSSFVNKEESDISKEYKRLSDFDISFDDLPDGKELVEIAFPDKIVHFCHTCNLIITSYRLFYLHMHILHQLEKRFSPIYLWEDCLSDSSISDSESSISDSESSISDYLESMNEHYC